MTSILMDLLAAILALSGAGSAEEIGEGEMERYRHFAEHPLQLNRMPAARLRSSGLFTDYQLAAIDDYRARSGDILGPTEFALVDGIGPDAAEALVHFVSFEPSAYSGKGRLRQDLTLRGGVREKGGTEWLSAVKYHLEAGPRAEFFWSSSRPYSAGSFVPGTFSLALYGKGGGSLVAGDFSARFGQGLAAWSGLTMSGFPSVAAFRRNTAGIAPTGSFSPVLSGLAGSFQAGRLRFSAGLSSPGLRSFLAGKASSGRSAVPLAAASYLGRRGQAGVQGLWQDGAVVSADGVFGLGHWTLFGETALSSRMVTENGCGILRTRLAAVGGVGWAPAYRVQFAFLGRYYPAGFYSPLAGAVRSFSSLAGKDGSATGESGVSFGARWHRAEFTADAAFRPDTGSARGARHFKTVFNFSPADTSAGAGPLRVSPSVRWTERFRPADPQPWRHELRADLACSLRLVQGPVHPASARASVRADIVRSKGWGRLFYAELGYVSEGFITGYLRFTAFDIPRWDDRIYCYERDLPGTFNVPAYYRRGRALSAVASLKLPSGRDSLPAGPAPRKRVRHTLNMRASLLRYPHGTGTPATEIKLQYTLSSTL